MKLVINDGYGGFGLSEKALDKWYRLSLKNYRNKDTNELKKLILFNGNSIPRNDKNLISIVEEIGEEAEISSSDLLIVKIPNDTPFYIFSTDEGHDVVFYFDFKLNKIIKLDNSKFYI